MRPALQLRQSQQLALTPQLQQSIRLLQLSTQEINQEVARLLDENPLLEREDENSAPPYAAGETTAAAPAENSATAEEERPRDEEWDEPVFSASSSPDDEEEPHSELAADTPSLREHLLWQLNMSTLDARDKKIVGLLIDALDENGYLAQPLEEIAELLPRNSTSRWTTCRPRWPSCSTWTSPASPRAISANA